MALSVVKLHSRCTKADGVTLKNAHRQRETVVEEGLSRWLNCFFRCTKADNITTKTPSSIEGVRSDNSSLTSEVAFWTCQSRGC